MTKRGELCCIIDNELCEKFFVYLTFIPSVFLL